MQRFTVPPFELGHRLSQWAGCNLEFRCAACRNTRHRSVRALISAVGNHPFKAVIHKLRCSHCGGSPELVYLCAGETRERSWSHRVI